MTKLFWRKPLTVTLAFVMALALPLCGMFSLLAAAEDNEIIYQEDDGGGDAVYDDIVIDDDPADDEIEENSEPEEADEADEDNGDDEPAIMAYAEIEDDGDEPDGDNDAMYLGEADGGDDDVATPGNTESDEEQAEEPEQEEIEEADPEQNTEEPQIITIAAFAEFADEILYQGFDLPAEDEAPLTLGDINFPMTLEATDTDGGAITVALDYWLGDDYDLATMGMYTFTAKLPDGYALGDGATMPEIIVIVRPADLAIAPMAAEVSVSTLEALQAAITETPVGDSRTITLAAKLTLSGAVILDGTDKNITIMRGISGDLITVGNGTAGNGASLTLKNITIDGGNKVEGGDFVSSGGGSLVYANYGTLTMNSGAVLQNNTSSSTGGGVNLYGSGTVLEMSGNATISGNTTSSTGGGVYVSNNCKIEMSGDAKISNNTATTNGGGVHLYTTNSTLTMTGGEISGNSAGASGGGVYANSNYFNLGGESVISGNTLSNGTTKSNVYLPSGKTITLSTDTAPNGMYVGVTLESGTGTIVSSGASSIMQYFFFSDAGYRVLAKTEGAVTSLEIGNDAPITALESFKAQIATFNNNFFSDMTITVAENFELDELQTITNAYGDFKLTITGGGKITRGSGVTGNLFTVNSGANLILQNITIDGNKSVVTDAAGSLVKVNGGTFTMNSGTISGNKSTDGGGVNVVSGTFTMNSGAISDNTATDGGGVNIEANGVFNMEGGTISGNASTRTGISYGGGGVFMNGGTFNMTGGTISGNKAAATGGGVSFNFTGNVVTLGGDAVITGNKKGTFDGDNFTPVSDSNVHLLSGMYITIENPTADMEIGVTHATTSGDVEITSGSNATEAIAECFTSDNENRIIVCKEDGKLYLTDKAISIIGAEVEQSGALTYNGTEQIPEFTVTLDGGATYLVAGTDYTVTGATDAGDHTATITGIGGYKDEKTGTYTIGKATLTVTPSATINIGEDAPTTAAAADLSYSGFVGSEDKSVVSGTAALTTDYVAGNKAGEYNITVNDVSGLSADNYDFVASAESGSLTVKLQSPVTTFAQLKAAVLSYADATENMTITVGADITMTERLSVPANSGRTLTITSTEGNAFTIKRGETATGNLFTMSSGTFALQNITIDGNNTVVTSAGGSLVRVTGGTFTMNSGAVVQNNTTTGSGGGVYVESGTFNMTGGEIKGNNTNYGGGVFVASTTATFNMKSGTISGNTTISTGGGVTNYGTFNMEGGTISSNEADDSGGGVGQSGGTFNMTGGTISGNKTYYSSGGGVYINGGTVTLGGSAKITDNTKGSSTVNNVYLVSGKTITLSTATEPTTGMSVGVTHATTTGDVEITNTNGTNATEAIAGYFFSDVAARKVILDGNVLKLVTPVQADSLTVTHSALTYNGTPQTPTFTVKDGGTTLTEGIHYSITVTAQTDAGIYDGENAATITGIGKYTGTAPVSITIAQRDLDEVEIGAIDAWEYNGMEQEPTPNVNDGDITISENDYTVSYTDNKNVGTAAKVILTGKGNYTGEKETTFEITKATLTVTADNKGVNYLDEPPTYTAQYSGFVGEDIADHEGIVRGAPQFGCDYTNTSPVTTYTITVSQGSLEADNYSFAFVSGTLTVGKGNQADLEITGAPEEAITYGDSGFTLVTTGGSSGVAVTYEVTSGTAVSVNATTGEVTIKGAGNATITATRAGDDNYVSKSATVDITVNPAELTVTAKDETIKYGENAPEYAILSYDGFKYDDDSTAIDETELTFICLYNKDTNGGVDTYTITPNGLTSDNYTFNYISGTLTVTQSAQDTLTITDPGTKTWGDTDFDLETEGGSGTGAVSYTIVSGDDVISISGNTVTILKAGTATVTATKAGDDNYELITSDPITITVNNAEQGTLTIDGGNIEKTYGDIAFTLSTSGGNGDGTVTYASSDTDVVSIEDDTATIHKTGEVTVTATKAGDDKYNAATSDAITVTVAQRDITSTGITVTVADGTYTYKGEAHTPSYTVADSGAAITDNDYDVTYGENINVITGGSITLDGKGNYTGTKTVNFTIVPAALTITGKDFELTYGDDAPNLDSFGADDVTVVGLMERDTFPNDFTGTLAFAYDTANTGVYVKGSDADKYYIDPSGLSSNNYTITYINGTLTVKKAQQDTLTITDPGTITWGDADFDLSTGDTGSGGGDVTFEITDGSDVISIDGSTVTILKAGTATVTATKAASTNYLEATDDVEITVNPRDITDAGITVTVTGSHTYTGLQQKPTFTVTDSGATITLSDYDVTYGENKNVSTGGSITLAGKGNYTGRITQSFAITKAALTVTADNINILYGTAIPNYTYTITGYANNETATVITGSPILSCSYIKGYSVGGYFIDVDVSGLTAANYSITDSPGRLTVQTTTGAAVSAAPAVAMKTAASITLNAVANAAEEEQLALIPEGIEGSAQSVEYAISTTETAPTAASDWQDSTVFTELAQSTTYYVFARTAANNNYYAGIPQMSAAIETDGLYTVQFAVTNSGAASGSTVKATYDGVEITSGTIVQGGKTLVLTASGKGASTYSYSWVVNDTKDGNTASITMENLAKAVNATCTVSGTAASSSRESSSSREESSSQAESSAVAESSSQAESSAAESSASSSEAEQPASSVSEASSTAESVSEAAAESSATESAAESSAAAAESAAESARAAESDSERDNARDSDSDRSRSDSDSGRETKKEPETIAEAIQEVREKAAEVITEMFSGARTPVGPKMDLSLDVDIGSAVYGRGIMLNAKGLKPFTEIKVTVYSEPQVLGVQTADEYGEAALWAVFPEDLEEGIHTVIAEGIGTLDEPIQSVSMVEIDGQGILLQMMEASQVMEPIDPGDKSLVRAMEAGKPIYDPARNPGTVAGATLAICVTGGGLAAMAGLSKPGKHSRNREERRSNDGEGLGDGGFLWKLLPFRAASDRFSIAIQESTSRISFTLHRFVSDGVWSRAMFSSGGFLLWVLGAGMGYYASMQVGFKALPPDFSIVLAIVALGFLDAGAGFFAWLMIALCAVCTGHVSGINDVCTLLGMFTLFAALMTLSGSRPLRREYKHSKKFIFDRIMDYIIPTVYLMIASSAILNVINGLSGLELFSEENGRTIKLVSVVALWVRLILEDIAINLFPRRYSQVYADAEIKQSFPLVLGAIALYISMFVIVSIPFFGFGIMLMFLLALDIIPSLLMYAEDYLPNSQFLSKWYPGADSTYASLVLTVIGVFLTLQLMTGTTDYRNMSVAMVILAIPTAVAEIPSLFGRDEIIQRGWFRRVAEVGCWALFALISLDIIKLV